MTDLYLLQDGTHAAPGDVSADKAGVLRHKNGLAVCLYEDGRPQTVAEDAERNKNVEAAKAGEEAKPVAAPPAAAARPAPDIMRAGEHPRADMRREPNPAAPHEPKAG